MNDPFMSNEASAEIMDLAARGERHRWEGSENLVVKFYQKAVLDRVKSAEEGINVFKDKTYVTYRAAGKQDNIIDRPMREDDKVRFQRQWNQYLANEEQTVEGTPLVEWPALRPAEYENLKAMGIQTVEQLAELADVKVQGFMGVPHLKGKAKAWLAARGDVAAAAEVERQLAERDARIAELENRLVNMEAMMQKQAS